MTESQHGDGISNARVFDTPEQAFAAPTTEDVWRRLKELGIDPNEVRASMTADEYAQWFTNMMAGPVEDIEA